MKLSVILISLPAVFGCSLIQDDGNDALRCSSICVTGDFSPLKKGNKWVYLGKQDGSISISGRPDSNDSALTTLEITGLEAKNDTLEYTVDFRDSLFARNVTGEFRSVDTVITRSLILSEFPNGQVFEKNIYGDTARYFNTPWFPAHNVGSGKTYGKRLGDTAFLAFDSTLFVSTSSYGGVTTSWTLLKDIGVFSLTIQLGDRSFMSHVVYELIEFNGRKPGRDASGAKGE